MCTNNMISAHRYSNLVQPHLLLRMRKKANPLIKNRYFVVTNQVDIANRLMPDKTRPTGAR